MPASSFFSDVLFYQDIALKEGGVLRYDWANPVSKNNLSTSFMSPSDRKRKLCWPERPIGPLGKCQVCQMASPAPGTD